MVRAAGVLVMLVAATAWADEPLSVPLDEPTTPRSAALGGATRAYGNANDAIWLNPGALNEVQRYTFAMDGLFDLRGGHEEAGLSVADSTTAPVSAGIAAHRLWLGSGDSRVIANVFDVGLSTPLGDFIVLGAGGKLIHVRAAGDSKNHLAPDLSLFIKATPLQVGLVAYNLVNAEAGLTPRQYAVAANLTLPRIPRVEADVVFDTTTRPDVAMAYHFGAEYEFLALFALRAGYVEDKIREQRTVSGGFGFSIPPGVTAEVSYLHDLLGTHPARELIFGMSVGL